MSKNQEAILDGPMSYSNWLAHNNEFEIVSISEYPLFTDARIVGELIEGLGPYQLLNTLPTSGPGTLQTAIVLRAKFYLTYSSPDWTKTDVSNYHGGWYSDEIAALISLCLGVRLKAGDQSRRFDRMTNDPLGRPQSNKFKNDPILTFSSYSSLKIPNAARTINISEINHLKVIPHLSKKQVVGMIRAARLYQDALWIAESEPALAWVMFVSALEVGANLWHKKKESAASKLKELKPDLYNLLVETCIEDLPQRVANQIVQTLGSTTKFINFVLHFLPEPPEPRPNYSQIDWSEGAMKEILKQIYDYRSRALHDGVPFPAPMCSGESPIEGILPERPSGLATSTQNATWIQSDTPMLLHIFEHITRRVLLKWFESLKATSQVRKINNHGKKEI